MGSASQVFLSRLTSTLTLWGVCGATIYWASEPGFWFLLLTLIIRALWEFLQMLSAANLPHFKKTTITLGAISTAGALITAKTLGSTASLLFALASASLSILWIFIRQIFRKNPLPLPISSISLSLLGLFYIPFLATFTSALLYITPKTSSGTLTGHFYLLFLISVTKFSDCGAYVTGSLIGKHLMIPHVSPKKTWEGFAGALTFSAASAWALYHFFPQQLSLLAPSHIVPLAIILSIIAVLGDLAESVIKRSTGIKDSGHFLPGIGGAMDLIDSLLFTGPIFYFYLHLRLVS